MFAVGDLIITTDGRRGIIVSLAPTGAYLVLIYGEGRRFFSADQIRHAKEVA
jgi:hypothetical protein